MVQGRQTTRLDKIEDAVNQRRPQGPPLMAQAERWEIARGLVHEILNGDDGSMGRKFVALVGLNRVAVSNILKGGGGLGLWGDDDNTRRVNEWLVGQDAASGGTALASH